jgi:hypothetical protein
MKKYADISSNTPVDTLVYTAQFDTGSDIPGFLLDIV